MRHSIIPPYLLRRLTTLEDPALAHVAQAARESLAMDETIRRHRSVAGEPGTHGGAHRLEPPARSIFDAERTETLPGTLVRSEDDAPSPDVAVNEAFVEATVDPAYTGVLSFESPTWWS